MADLKASSAGNLPRASLPSHSKSASLVLSPKHLPAIGHSLLSRGTTRSGSKWIRRQSGECDSFLPPARLPRLPACVAVPNVNFRLSEQHRDRAFRKVVQCTQSFQAANNVLKTLQVFQQLRNAMLKVKLAFRLALHTKGVVQLRASRFADC